jgi:hypothetical protein
MNYLFFSKTNRSKFEVPLVAIASLLFLSASVRAQVAYFDPMDTGTPAGGSGEFNGATSWESGGANGPFVSGESAVFDGAAGTVTVNADVNVGYTPGQLDAMEIGVTSGTTETIGTSGADASQITFGPILLNQNQTIVGIDSGTESVVFNSNLNLNLEAQTYGNIYVTSATSGNVAIEGGINFTNNASDATDPGNHSDGSPGLDLDATTSGGTFTLDSAVTSVEVAGNHPTQNGNQPTLLFTGSNANNTLTLTTGASFTNTRVEANGGTILDQGATFVRTNGVLLNGNGPIFVGGGGQYLADTAGMTISDTVSFTSGGGSIGSDLAAVTTFSGDNSYNNGLVAIAYANANDPMDLTAGAGGRVNILGDVVNANGGMVSKTGAGIVNIDDNNNARIQQYGWDIQNGTLLANSSGTITTGGLSIGNVATSALVPNTQTYATLGGLGNVSALTTAVGANSSITPGDPTVNNGIGTLTLSGGLTATSGLTLNFVLNGEGTGLGTNSSLLIVPTLTLDGVVTVNFTTLDTVVTDSYYTVMSANNEPGSTWTGTPSFTFNAPAGYEVEKYIFDKRGDTFSVEFEAVPEPSTWALMGLGALLVAGAARFRKQQV